MRTLTLALIACALFALGSCTDEQIARAQVFVDQTDVRLAQANQAVELAKQAVAEAKALAEQFQSEGAKAAASKAEAALGQVIAARDIAASTDKAAHDALTGAKAAQDAGGSTLNVLLAAGKGALPMALLALTAAVKWWRALQAHEATKTDLAATQAALTQTVTGLDDARNSMGDAVWDQHVAPNLAAAQDAHVKATVALVQAKQAA
jgi:hypothetical protein